MALRRRGSGISGCAPHTPIPSLQASSRHRSRQLPLKMQQRFLAQLVALPEEIEVLPIRELSWLMAELQQRHRAKGRAMSAAMVEALAAAHVLGAGIAVSKYDIGPVLRNAARADCISFRAL